MVGVEGMGCRQDVAWQSRTWSSMVDCRDGSWVITWEDGCAWVVVSFSLFFSVVTQQSTLAWCYDRAFDGALLGQVEGVPCWQQLVQQRC